MIFFRLFCPKFSKIRNLERKWENFPSICMYLDEFGKFLVIWWGRGEGDTILRRKFLFFFFQTSKGLAYIRLHSFLSYYSIHINKLFFLILYKHFLTLILGGTTKSNSDVFLIWIVHIQKKMKRSYNSIIINLKHKLTATQDLLGINPVWDLILFI